MASSNKFSFAEDEQRSIIECYSSTVEEITQATQKFVESVAELCEKVKYKPVVDFTNACIEFYNTELLGEIRNNFEKWRDSEGCLSAFINTMDGGEEAEQTAQGMESGLEQAFEDQFHPFDEIQMDTSAPEIEEEDYETLSEKVKEYKDEVQGIYDSAKSKIDDSSEDNNAYSTVKGVVAGTASGIMAAFEEIERKVDELKDLFAERAGKSVDDAGDISDEIERAAESSAKELFESVASNFGGEL
jgi:TATA-box binding protein (TBP) (component of TFIID and TFIIIB)